MKIANGTVVTLAYDITDEAGEIIETSEISGPITFLHGTSRLIPGLDRRLVGMEAGQEATFSVPPEEAFGKLEDAPVRPIPRSEFPSDGVPDVGAQFEANTPEGQVVRLHVVEIGDDVVMVRLAHPLAGQSVEMSVRVVAVRAATKTEATEGTVRTAPPPPPVRAAR